jgi:hypothetical protein
MKKLTLLTGIGIGYVLGSRAGRERFEQIRSGAKKLAGNPTVQSAASKAQETVSAQAPVVADAVKEKAASAASAVAGKVHRGESGGDHVADPATRL